MQVNRSVCQAGEKIVGTREIQPCYQSEGNCSVLISALSTLTRSLVTESIGESALADN